MSPPREWHTIIHTCPSFPPTSSEAYLTDGETEAVCLVSHLGIGEPLQEAAIAYVQDLILFTASKAMNVWRRLAPGTSFPLPSQSQGGVCGELRCVATTGLHVVEEKWEMRGDERFVFTEDIYMEDGKQWGFPMWKGVCTHASSPGELSEPPTCAVHHDGLRVHADE